MSTTPVSINKTLGQIQTTLNQLQGLFNELRNIAFLVDGPIYIADDQANAVFAVPNNPINPAGSSEYPPANASSDLFRSLVDVFYNLPDGSIYALDTDNAQVYKFTSLSEITTTGIAAIWGIGTPGSGANQFANPLKVFVDVSGNVYVADTANNRIQFINGTTGNWTQLYGPGGAANNPGGKGVGNYLNAPCGLAVQGNGAVIVADTNNGRLVQITNAAQGAPAATDWQTYSGPSSGPFKYPGSVALDPYGLIYVFDWGAPYPGGVAGTGARLIAMSDMSGTGWEVNSTVNNLTPMGNQIQGRIWVGAQRAIYLTQGPNLYYYDDFGEQNPVQYPIPGAGALVGLCVSIHGEVIHFPEP